MEKDNPNQLLYVTDENVRPKPQRDGVQKAVAISYEQGNADDAAPMVVASGKGSVAEQIIALAFAHGVRVRKDQDLVEVLSQVEVESPIPLEAFAAVAEILSYVYQANAIYGKPKSKNK
jgi:flagellar biosynthesis protein